MGALFLEIVTPEKVLVSQEVDMVVVPGTEGQFGILPEHINFLSGIVQGELHFESNNSTQYMSVNAGFAEVSANKVSILVDSAEMADQIDIERAQKSMDRAKERLAQEREKEDIDFLRAEIALQRALIRLKVAGKNVT